MELIQIKREFIRLPCRMWSPLVQNWLPPQGTGESQESGSCSVSETGCLRNPHLESRGSLRKQVVLGLHWDPEELGSNVSEGMPQKQER